MNATARFWKSVTALLPLSHRSNPDQMPCFKKNKQRKKKNTVYEINRELVSDGLILISFKSSGVFPVAGFSSRESGSLSMTWTGFGPGPRWAVAALADAPGFQPRRLKRLQDQPGRGTRAPQARLQQNFLTAPRGDFGQIVTDSQMAGPQLEPTDHLPLEPADKSIYDKQPKLPSAHLLCRVRYWNRTDWRCLLTLYTYIHQCFCKPPTGS